jgi:3-phenylpropionate/trans-cinnamate dioxygenase ferredoxin reductase subunit
MTSFHVSVGEHGSFRARRGETLLDAALINGVDIPHDCRSGHCGSCRCKVESGTVEGGAVDDTGTVLACQARVTSDLDISIEDTPPIETFSGKVRWLQHLSKDITEVTIETKQPLDYLPGQYVQVKFAGFPARCYSPTLPLGGPVDRGAIRLQVKRVRNGRVSTALGEAIQPGHKVKIVGPYGSAYLRTGLSNRLVLVAGGAGFAPIWSIAHAALCEMPDREIVIVVGANRGAEFYMAQALLRLITFPKTTVIAVVREAERPDSAFKVGSPLDYMPALSPDDIVYACGAPRMVEGVLAVAKAAGACCYADPFVPAAPERNMMAWAPRMLAAASPMNVLRWFDGGAEVVDVR